MWGKRLAISVATAAAAAVLLGPVVPAQAASALSFDATLNGRQTSSLSTNNPLVLHRGSPLRVALTVHNDSGRAITVAAARIQGRVMGLSFFSFDTQLNLKVAAHSDRSTRFEVGLSGLADQADGLLPTSVSLLNNNSDDIASKDITVDVKGHLTSIYGVFGLAIAAITILWLISLIYRVSQRALPENRWRRAMQFSAAGFGVGLALTFSVSALRLLTPDAAVWAPLVFGAGLVGLAVGYLTPGPRPVDPDEEQDFIAARERQYARVSGGSDEEFAAARASGPVAAPAEAGQSSGAASGGTSNAASSVTQPVPDGPMFPDPPASATTTEVPARDTTVQASRSDLDSIFGSEYGTDERGPR